MITASRAVEGTAPAGIPVLSGRRAQLLRTVTAVMDRSSHETAGQERKNNDPDKKRCVQECPTRFGLQLIHDVQLTHSRHLLA
jgi:hypothetical protein